MQCREIVKQFIQGTMYRLFLIISTLVLVSVCTPRTPRIYNVLISTRKNLAPSHAVPVYEPVLRTTSFGVAFPPYQPLIYHQPSAIHYPAPLLQQFVSTEKNEDENKESNENKEEGQEQFVPLAENANLAKYFPYLAGRQKFEQQKIPTEIHFEKVYDPNSNDENPKNIIANFKKNPEIPDVPPPALPVKA